jgi:EAL domain-containing protein (putative c-di-GMP-specific phosphodiesterase class I)
MSTTFDTSGDIFSTGRRRFSRGHVRAKNHRKVRSLIGRVNGSSDELDAEILAELREERTNLIRAMIANRNWETHFQPIVDLKSGDAIGTEALSRFADGSIRAPDKWFAEAAEVGLGIELEVAALDAALEQLPQLPNGLYLSLNASVETIMSDDFESRLDDVPAERIVLELTEHTRVNDYANFGRGLESLRSEGVRLAVDDTGAGFASLQHVLNLRPDIIKLDVGLTRGIDRDPARRALGRALLTFGLDAYDASIVAEGIETEGELEVLRSLGCPCGQGFYLGRPRRLTQVEVPHSHHLHVVSSGESAADLPLLMRELLDDLEEAESEGTRSVGANGNEIVAAGRSRGG